jgi:hypothetical protein
MSIDKILDDIAAHLKTHLPELETSKMSGGRIDLAEVNRRTMKLPAAFVTFTGSRDAKLVANKVQTRGHFLLVLAVRSYAEDQPVPQDRAHAIVRFLGRVLDVVVKAKNWGSSEIQGPPEKTSSTNPYTTSADQEGVALWGVTWEQMLLLVPVDEPTNLVDFLLLDAQHQIVPSNPEIDAENKLVLEGGQP